MSKFQKVIPKVPWTKEYTQTRIDSAWSEIKEFNKQINEIDSKISGLLDLRQMLKRKISNKTIYVNQLSAQMSEETNPQINSDNEADAEWHEPNNTPK